MQQFKIYTEAGNQKMTKASPKHWRVLQCILRETIINKELQKKAVLEYHTEAWETWWTSLKERASNSGWRVKETSPKGWNSNRPRNNDKFNRLTGRRIFQTFEERHEVLTAQGISGNGVRSNSAEIQGVRP